MTEWTKCICGTITVQRNKVTTNHKVAELQGANKNRIAELQCTTKHILHGKNVSYVYVFNGLYGVEVSLQAAVNVSVFSHVYALNIRHLTLYLEERNAEEVGLLRSDEEEQAACRPKSLCKLNIFTINAQFCLSFDHQ